MGGSQGHAGRRWAVSREESLVVIQPAVVVTCGRKVDQACEVTRDAGKRTMLKVVIGIFRSHEFARVVHRVLMGFPGFLTMPRDLPPRNRAASDRSIEKAPRHRTRDHEGHAVRMFQ